MKRIKKGKRLLAVALSVLLAFGGLPTAALAEGQPVQVTQGLCEHHLEHTAECGYGEGQPCEHEHSEDCYTNEPICGYDEEKETTASDSDAEHTHTQECYALDCPHERGEHNADCGYAEAQPCGYTCELCGKTDNEPEPGDETEQTACTLTEGCTLADGHEGECATEQGEGEKETACTLTEGCTLPTGHEGACVTELPAVDSALVKTITSWTFVGDDNLNEGELPMPGVSMEKQADFDTVVSMLPTGISAEIEGETDPVPVDITGWSCQEYVQDADNNWPVAGEYVFTAKLRSGYVCDPLPTVKVLIGGAELYDGIITRPGYTFNQGNGELTIENNDGTSLWRDDRQISKDAVKKVILKDGVTTIDREVFSECINLTTATIPDSVQTIKSAAFYGCVQLFGTLAIPQGVTSIKDYAFAKTGFTSLDLSKATKLTTISDYMCSESKLTGTLAIPANITHIGIGAFGNTNITSLDLSNASKLETIDNGAFSMITTLSTVKIPESVKIIGQDAFQGTALTSVDLSEAENLETIGNGAFRETGISSITIPQSVTKVDNFAFLDCSNLTSVTFTSQSAPALGLKVFDNTSPNLVIHVPENAIGYDGENWPANRVVKDRALTLNGLASAYTYGDAAFALSTSGGSDNGAVSYTSSNESVASVAGSQVTILKAGTFTITATKAADDNYAEAKVTSGMVTVNPATPGISLNATGGSDINDPIVLTATVSKVGTGTTPTGTVTFSEGDKILADNVILNGSGEATCTVSNLTGGNHTYTVAYSGQSGYYTPASTTFEITKSNSSSGGGGGSSGSSNEGSNGGSSSSNDSTVTAPKDSYTSTGKQIGQSVSRSDLQRLANAGKSLTIQSGTVTMTFDPAALKAILEAVPATAGNITFAVVPADISAFPDTAKLIGTRPAYSFTISYKDSKGNAIPVNVNFPAGSASISLNYFPAEGEVAGSLFMVYVDGKGAVTWLDKSSYTSGKVLADVPHFSVYGVAYKAPVPVFTDITNHWAKADMEFVAARGLLSGTGEKVFSPDAAMTRGMFVTALGRLAGVNPASYQTRSFTDVKADAYYAAYVEWAAQKNIVNGTGEGVFSPDAPVTREQMAVMMTNYAGQMGYSIPAPLAAVTFADNDKISAWAAKEVAAMQRAGIIKGKDGNRFDPQENATRAEVSAVLRRFVEIVIDSATASGWVKNDSGHWLYYQGGKALTDWQTIGKLRYYFNVDGVMHEGWKQDTSTDKWYYWTNAGAPTGWREIDGKWYYFNENGVMAVNTKIDDYEVGPDGARKEN